MRFGNFLNPSFSFLYYDYIKPFNKMLRISLGLPKPFYMIAGFHFVQNVFLKGGFTQTLSTNHFVLFLGLPFFTSFKTSS